MKSIINLKFTSYLFIILCVTALNACNKDDDMVPKPIINPPTNGGNDTTTVGNTITYHPSMTYVPGSNFIWTVNGEQKSTDSVYAFVPEERGDYQIAFTVSNGGGNATQNYQLHAWGKYENGFFIVNEGWYGHGTGIISFFRYNSNELEDSVFVKENPGKDFEPSTSTLEYGAVYKDKLYILSKVGGPLVAADAYSLKETGRIASSSSNDFRAFAGIDDNNALVSTSDGIYRINLQTMTLGSKVSGIDGEVADMIKVGNYVFALSQNDGVVVLNVADNSIAKTFSGFVVGFAQTPDGNVWAAGGTSLLQINSSTLDTASVALPFDVYGSFGFWHPGSITASTKENTVFIAAAGSFTGATTIYKYVSGDAASVQSPFINIPTGKELYGSGVGYDPEKNTLVVTTVQSGYGENYSFNDLYFYDPSTGSQTGDVAYSGYYFPAVPVFH